MKFKTNSIISILLDQDWNAKLSDFGLAQAKFETPLVTQTTAAQPEAFDSNSFITEKVNIYRFGMILYELMTFQAPFPGMNMMQVTAQLLQGRTPIIPSHCNEDIALLIKQCWDQQPANLPGIHTILVQLEKIMEGK